GAKPTAKPAADTNPPPVPTITSHPSSLTSATTASFAFKDSEHGATSVCLLDVGVFTPCSRRKTYTTLTDGPHSFYVAAVDAVGNVGAKASFAWTVDTTPPPAPAITGSPTNPSGVAVASFSFTDSEQAVTFFGNLGGGLCDDCTSPQVYAHVGDGSHLFGVMAVDAAGNTSPAKTFAWTVDTTPPATPTITSGPALLP